MGPGFAWEVAKIGISLWRLSATRVVAVLQMLRPEGKLPVCMRGPERALCPQSSAAAPGPLPPSLVLVSERNYVYGSLSRNRPPPSSPPSPGSCRPPDPGIPCLAKVVLPPGPHLSALQAQFQFLWTILYDVHVTILKYCPPVHTISERISEMLSL